MIELQNDNPPRRTGTGSGVSSVFRGGYNEHHLKGSDQPYKSSIWLIAFGLPKMNGDTIKVFS